MAKGKAGGMDVYDAIRTRKSVRSYLDKPVPDAVLRRVLDAARMAPSASNRQEWRFVVVRNPETRMILMDAAKKQAFVAEAPVVIACCAVTDGHVMTCGQLCYPIDVAIAIDHLTLAAVAEGLGTCWVGAFEEEAVQVVLGIPHGVRVVELLALGYPVDAAPISKQRASLRDIVKYETW